MIWPLPARVFTGLVLAALFALTIWSTMVIARMAQAVFFPHAIRFVLAAALAWTVALAYQQPIRTPSLRALQASLVVALLAYFLSPLLMFQALRVLPSGVVCFSFALLPVFALLGYSTGRGRFLYAILALGTVITLIVGVEPLTLSRGNAWLASAILLGGLFSYLIAIWFTKKVFWLYSSWEMTFWSLFFGAVLHVCLGLVVSEPIPRPGVWPSIYWVYMLGSSGLFALFIVGYRVFAFRLGKAGIAALGAGLPILGIVLGAMSWRETPVNLIVVVGAAVGIAVVCFNGFFVKPAHWLAHALYNDIRKGDRLAVRLEGFLSGENCSSARVRVEDISIGGLGILTEGQLEVGQTVTLDLPLSKSANQVTLECQVVHHHPSKDAELPLFAGLVWGSMSAARTEDVVEFLAKTGRVDI